MQHESFKAWLREALDKSSLSAKEFSDRAKLSKPLVYFYLTGHHNPTPESMTRIAEVLGVDVGEIMHFAQKVGRPARTPKA